MDIERVNIVFNYDMPENSDTYLHRVSDHYIISFVKWYFIQVVFRVVMILAQ